MKKIIIIVILAIVFVAGNRSVLAAQIKINEIMPSNSNSLYDENFNLLKSGIQGFARINNLLDYINRNSGDLNTDSNGDNSLTNNYDPANRLHKIQRL